MNEQIVVEEFGTPLLVLVNCFQTTHEKTEFEICDEESA